MLNIAHRTIPQTLVLNLWKLWVFLRTLIHQSLITKILPLEKGIIVRSVLWRCQTSLISRFTSKSMKLWSLTTTWHRIVLKRENTKTQRCFKTRSMFRSSVCLKKCPIKIAYKTCHFPLLVIAYNNFLTNSSLLLESWSNKKRSSSILQTLRMIPRLNATATIKKTI